MQIGIDLMGSDQPPQAIFEAVLQVSKELDFPCTLAVIAESSFFPDLKKQLLSFIEIEEGGKPPSINFIPSGASITMEDHPLLAVRRKKNSSMSVGLKLLKEKTLDAFVSTGNTGALFANAMVTLDSLPGITRPALLVLIPTTSGEVAVLDVGANVSYKPQHLVDYAKLGMAYRMASDGLENPKVGLLNIGVEEQKGPLQLKESYQILIDFFAHSKGTFLGNIEGRDVFHGKVDVLVTDGFTGNVFLKTCEGVSSFLLDYIKEKVLQKAKDEIFAELHQQFNYSKHPGAILCGVDGLVIKCHGYSNARALISGIKGAIRLAKKDVISKMKAELSQNLS